ncbi:MAG TPA: sensor histidine kinase [Flavobacteriales bacterium]|nr:sensor histidine kinase [Flavobacteriales bacterium]
MNGASGKVAERWLIIGIAGLMVLTLAILARVIHSGNQREEDLARSMLDGAIANQNQRVRLLLNTYVWALEEQAGHFTKAIPSSDTLMLEHWLPVLRSRPAIRTIALADDQGNEWLLQHNDSLWRYTMTLREAGKVRSMTSLFGVGGRPLQQAASPATRPDPRETEWFSHALENRMGEPVWSESNKNEDGTSLDLSMLIQRPLDHSTLRVIRFAIDGDLMLTQDIERNPETPGTVLNSKWQPINLGDTTASGRLWADALATHRTAMALKPYQFEAQGKRWLGQIVPLYLNGTKFHSGVLIGFEGIERWGNPRRLALWSVLTLLALLSLLLTIVFLQSRGAERKVLRQRRRSDLQARHLAQAIGEREVLDREVHHRVKNNLQVVSSLLNLHAQRIPDEEVRTEFLRGKRRIDSMALVHHKLYRQSDLSAVDLGVFLNDIANAMAAMFDPASRMVSHSVDAKEIRSDADTSIQLGMILCELLANSHQHAFPYPTGGHIGISIDKLEDGSYRLVVKDNGKGFDPATVDGRHLGLEVVEALAEQLDGSFRLTNDGGTVAEVTFRIGIRS